jgi:hypothetical protein
LKLTDVSEVRTASIIALMVETVRTFEKSVNKTLLHGATTQKTLIITSEVDCLSACSQYTAEFGIMVNSRDINVKTSVKNIIIIIIIISGSAVGCLTQEVS